MLIMLFLLTSPAYAALSDNLLSNANLRLRQVACGSGSVTIPVDTWYVSPGWTWNAGAYELLEIIKTAISFNSCHADYLANGTIALQFDQRRQNTVSIAQIALYGYSTAPSFANISASGSSVGTQIVAPTSTSPGTSWSTWTLPSSTTAGYNYYLVWIDAKTGTGGSNYMVDNASLKVTTPLPPAVWLLGSGFWAWWLSGADSKDRRQGKWRSGQIEEAISFALDSLHDHALDDTRKFDPHGGF